jgi:hypothetical protein
MLGGFYLLFLSQVYELTQKWVILSLISYFVALITFSFGFFFYRWSGDADMEGSKREVGERLVFTANLLFGVGLVALTAVIVLMSLKDEATHLLSL